MCLCFRSLPALIKVVAGPDGLRSLAFDEDLQGASYLALTRWLERQNHRLMVEIGPETFSRYVLTCCPHAYLTLVSVFLS